MLGLIMASEESSYNQDAHAIPQAHPQQDQCELVTGCTENCEHVVSTNVRANVSDRDVHEEHSDFPSRYSLYSVQQECHDTTTKMIFTPAPSPALEQTATPISSEEFYLQRELQKQKLQHRIYEERLEHLIKVKDLTHKLGETLPSFVRGMLPDAQRTNAFGVTSANYISVSNISSEPTFTVMDPDCSLEVELLKKLHSQRIQQQIEIEEAVHKLMQQLLNS